MRIPWGIWEPVGRIDDGPRVQHRAVILHTNGAKVPKNGDLFEWWSHGAPPGIGAHFQITWDGRCLTPEARVLTTGLRWVRLGDVARGDQLIAFDENGHGRYRCYRSAEVEGVTWAKEPVYGVVLDTEQVIYTTAEHRWLTHGHGGRFTWRQTKTGNADLVGAGVPRLWEPWADATDFDSGWLSGMFDGEGYLSARHNLQIAQRPTPVLEHLLALLAKRNIAFSVSEVKPGNDCLSVNIKGGLETKLSLLGELQPRRLIAKVRPDTFGMLKRHIAHGHDEVVAVYPAGIRDIVKLQTSTGTFIAEGYPMHNCYQYLDTDRYTGHAWDANSWTVGIETQDDGDPSNPWTQSQLDTIDRLLRELQIPAQLLVETPSDGIGWHEAFDSWNRSHHTCPGTVREAQLVGVIRRLKGDDDMATPADVAAALDVAEEALPVMGPALKGMIDRMGNFARPTAPPARVMGWDFADAALRNTGGGLAYGDTVKLEQP